jgi:hypothetical protein
MRKFTEVFKEKQTISESLLETKLLQDFKSVYSALLENYETKEFYDLEEDSQVAFLKELNEYWSEESGISTKGEKFLKDRSILITESSTDSQKKRYLKSKSSIIISEALRQTQIKNKIYQILDEMYKNTEASDIDEVLAPSSISETILESFGESIQKLMSEIIYEITPDETEK